MVPSVLAYVERTEYILLHSQQPAAVYSAVDRAKGCQMNTDYTSSVMVVCWLLFDLYTKKIAHCCITKSLLLSSKFKKNLD